MCGDRTRVAAGPPSRIRRVAGPLGAAVIVSGVAVALHLRDPHQSGSWGICPTLWLTGFACPFCGGLRAVNDLTHGGVSAAFSSNALLVMFLPIALVWWGSVVRDRWRGVDREWAWPLRQRGVMGVLTVVAVGFSLVRNTPWGAGLYP